MKNKFSIIFLGTIISLFLTNHCFANLKTPFNLSVPVNTIGEASALLSWEWDGKVEDVKQFKILYRGDGAINWEVKYPGIETRVGTSIEYNYVLRGLDADTEYEWKIKVEAENPALDSSYADGPIFRTDSEKPPEEDPGGEDPGGGEGDNTILNIFGGGEDGEGIKNIQEAADALMEFLVLTGFAVGPILIIYAAYLLLTKQGQPEAVTQAKKIILWTIISLSIMLFAKGIPSVVKDLFN